MSDPRISDPQCGTIRETVINFKSNEILRDSYRGDTIRESGTIRENTVITLKEASNTCQRIMTFCFTFKCKLEKAF